MNPGSSENSAISASSAFQKDAWVRLRRHTAARLALGRSGGSLPTREVLAFAHDHALARDAVHAPFDAEALAAELRALHPEVIVLASAATDRAAYLQRPDLGRRLAAESLPLLQAPLPQNGDEWPADKVWPQRGAERDGSKLHPDLVVLVSDGLSALAAHRQAPPLLVSLLPRLRAADFSRVVLVVVRHGRVAVQDEVGSLLHARQSLMLLGERPGLGTPDSLGAYLTYDPRPGRADAERNCVSNIRPGGLAPALAAEKIAALLVASRQQQLSGTGLKEAPPVFLPGRSA